MEAAASAEDKHEPTLANLLKQARKHQREAEKVQREMVKATKGIKVKKHLSDVKQPRKTSDGQRRWQAFQRFIWAKMQKTNPNVTFKNAISASGPLWAAGNPKEEVAAEFEEYLKENPIPSAEEAIASRQEKLEAAGLGAEALQEKLEAAGLGEEAQHVSRLTYFEKTLLTKMNDINDNVTRLIETLSPIEGGYRKTTRKHTINHKKSRKYRK